MAKTKLYIDPERFKQIIEKVEKESGPFTNRAQLHDAVAATEWAKTHAKKPITASVVALRIKEFGIEPQTPKGRRGIASGTRIGGTVDPEARSRNKKAKLAQPKAVEIFDILAAIAPTSFQRTIERAREGSIKSAIKIKCAECVGFEDMTLRIRECDTMSCALWLHRPYQSVTIGGAEVDEKTETLAEVG